MYIYLFSFQTKVIKKQIVFNAWDAKTKANNFNHNIVAVRKIFYKIVTEQ